jgi:uncharacterized membrane protein YoaK (UPF0700 family)
MAHEPIRSRAEFGIVLLGGLGLAAVAGYINTVVLLLGTLPVTHLTGTVSRLSLDLGEGNRTDAIFVAGLVVSFVFGATLSGVIIGSATLRLGRRYGVAVMVEAALIAAAAALIPSSLTLGAMLAAAAAGLQNAMASSYRSLIVRTTHVTGLLTDLGFMAGQVLGGNRIARWRFALIASLLIAFLAGGVAGVGGQSHLGSDALWIPAAGLAVGGMSYFVWRFFGSPARRAGIPDESARDTGTT